VLGRIAVSALGISIRSRNAIGEVQLRFGDKEKTRFVGEHGGPFRQIKIRGSQSPVLEFQTHFRTQSAFWRREKSQVEFEKTSKGRRDSTPLVVSTWPRAKNSLRT